MPDTDYYQGGDDDAAPDTATDDSKQPDEQQSAGDKSALVDKSIFGNTTPEVGATVQMRVVHIYDKEVELEPMGEDKSQSPAMDDAQDKLGSMAMMNGAATA